jgi:exonuclease III
VTKSKEFKWKKIWHGKPFFANGTSRRKGVAILLPKLLAYTLHDEKIDPNGRYIAIKIEFEGSMYGIINGYAPTADRLEAQIAWLCEITKILEEYGDTTIIFGGDINEGLTNLDKFVNRDKWKATEYVLAWKEACREYQMIDIWRVLNPFTQKYTWKQGTCKKNLRRSRLDFWLVSSSILYNVDKTTIVPGYASDHSMITLSLFKQHKSDQGPSFWKFNVSLLREKEYTDKVADDIVKLKTKYDDIKDKGLKWDLIKMELRMGAISYSKFIAKKRRDNIGILLKKQIEIENSISDNPSEDQIKESEQIKEEIEKHNAIKARGAWLRSKADWVEYGEKNSSFFLKLETRNRQVKNISTIIDDKGIHIKENDKILEEELRYYKALYTQPPDSIKENREETKHYFLSEETPTISAEDKVQIGRAHV